MNYPSVIADVVGTSGYHQENISMSGASVLRKM